MNPAESKYLARLDAAIGAETNPVRAACLRAERAGYRGRQGHFDEARSELDALRAEFGKKPQPEVSVWFCLLEGWGAYYKALEPVALDWFKRAHALSVAMSLGPLRALSAAWLAHMHYAFGTGEMAARHAQEALDLADPEDHASHARAALVVACLSHYCGRFDLAKPWYVRARTHARAIDDAQALSALSFNMASTRLREAQEAAVFNTSCDGLVRQAAVLTESTESFDNWMGGAALTSVVPTMRATIASLRGDHAEALALFGSDFSSVEAEGLSRIVPILLAERSWCRLQLEDIEGARADAQAAASYAIEGEDDDDRALAQGRLAQIYAGLGDRPRSEAHRARAHEALGRHRAAQAQAFNALVAHRFVEAPAPEIASSL